MANSRGLLVGEDNVPVEESRVLRAGQPHLALDRVSLTQHGAAIPSLRTTERQDGVRPLIEFAIYPQSGAG